MSLIALSSAAFAYFTNTAAGSSTAATSTLNPPTALTATPATTTVALQWSAPTAGAAPSGYYLTRTDSANNTVNACSTSPSALTSATSCIDTAVPAGTYTYLATAVAHTWTATSSPATATVAAAVAKPYLTGANNSSQVLADGRASVELLPGQVGTATTWTAVAKISGVASGSGAYAT